uniref:40S ribosomal protein S4 n=1 Tax=Rhizophora mucronata TaxID=61149 RepID=A0A2P2LEG4_RHIMU
MLCQFPRQLITSVCFMTLRAGSVFIASEMMRQRFVCNFGHCLNCFAI